MAGFPSVRPRGRSSGPVGQSVAGRWSRRPGVLRGLSLVGMPGSPSRGLRVCAGRSATAVHELEILTKIARHVPNNKKKSRSAVPPSTCMAFIATLARIPPHRQRAATGPRVLGPARLPGLGGYELLAIAIRYQRLHAHPTTQSVIVAFGIALHTHIHGIALFLFWGTGPASPCQLEHTQRCRAAPTVQWPPKSPRPRLCVARARRSAFRKRWRAVDGVPIVCRSRACVTCDCHALCPPSATTCVILFDRWHCSGAAPLGHPWDSLQRTTSE